MKFRMLLLTLLVTVAFNHSLAAGDSGCINQEIMNFLPPDVSGSVTLCTVKKGIHANVLVADLIPGNVYTVWWIYFDDASVCGIPYACGFDPNDFLGDNPLAVLGRLGSSVAGHGGVELMRGDWGGMKPSSGSQIALFLLDHGPAEDSDGQRLARQTLTPEDPFFGMPHHGNDVDGWLGIPVGFTVFQID